MKKRIALVLALVLCSALALTACKSGGADGVTTGLGHVVSLTDKTGEDGVLKAQVDAVFCAASFDKDGKVISVKIDNAQIAANFPDGALENAGSQQTKVDKGDNYGMKGNSGIKKEWYEQITSLEEWMKGKTVSEITGMKTKETNPTHTRVPDIADLTSSVTIDVGDYLDALEAAWKNKK